VVWPHGRPCFGTSGSLICPQWCLCCLALGLGAFRCYRCPSGVACRPVGAGCGFHPSDAGSAGVGVVIDKEFLLLFPMFSTAAVAGGGDSFRLDPRSGVGLAVRVGVGLRPVPRMDPWCGLTPQVGRSVSEGWFSCDRPLLVSGLSPWGSRMRIGEEVMVDG
jgi:hypothetical protein